MLSAFGAPGASSVFGDVGTASVFRYVGAVPVFGDVGADLEAVAEGEGEGVADHFVGEEVGCIYPYAYEMYSDAGRCE